MKKYLFVLAIAAFTLAGCSSSKQAKKERANNEVWQTLLVKQLDAQINDQIITTTVPLFATRSLITLVMLPLHGTEQTAARTLTMVQVHIRAISVFLPLLLRVRMMNSPSV